MNGRHSSEVAVGARRPDIQGLRAIAVLVVVLFHSGLPVPGGFVGVDVFFVISGFVITGMLHREWLATGRIRFAAFYVRRFKRLTPALAVMVAVTVVASVLISLGMGLTAAQTGVGALLLSANFVIASTTGGYFDAPAASNPLLHTWSLSVEEQFYLVFPVVLLLGWLISRRGGAFRAAPLVAASGMLVFSLLLVFLWNRGALHGIVPALAMDFYGPVGRVWEFAVGAVLSLALPLLPRLRSVTAAVIAGLGIAAVGASLWLLSETTTTPGGWTLLPVAGTALLLFAGSTPENPLSRVLATRPMVALGDLSYSWYLWHWPFIVFAGALVPGNPIVVLGAAAASLLAAIASYRWIERPIRGSAAVRGPRFVGLVAAVMVPPLALAGASWVAVSNGLWIPAVQEFQATFSTSGWHTTRAAGCTTQVLPSERKAGECVWNADAAGPPIYLIGDSHGDHFSEAAIGAGEALGRPVHPIIQHGCPYTGLTAAFTNNPGYEAASQCPELIDGTFDWLEQQPPGTVVIAFSDHYWRDPAFVLRDPETGDGVTDLERRVELQREWLTARVAGLVASGQRVLLVQAVPVYDSAYAPGDYPFIPLQCSVFTIANEDCNQEIPLQYAADRQVPMRAAVDAAAGATGASVLDVWSHFCRAGTCHTNQNRPYDYSDALHITPAASADLAPAFAKGIAGAG